MKRKPPMDPKLLFPVLAAGFALLAGWQAWRHGARHPATRTWALMALIFAGVAWWLRSAA